ncbi:MAG: hypothetical protein ACLGGV_05005 [Bacteroidia bacterium]
MKRSSAYIFCFLFLFLSSCNKVRNINAEFIKDCTGSYIRIDDKDYKICNIDDVEGYQYGDKIQVSFKKLENCDEEESSQIICMLYHHFETFAFITKIRKVN